MQWFFHSIDISEISLLFNVLFPGPIHVDYFLLHWWYLSLFSQLPIVGPLYQFWPWNCLADLWTQWKIWLKTILQVNNFQKVPFVLTFIREWDRKFYIGIWLSRKICPIFDNLCPVAIQDFLKVKVLFLFLPKSEGRLPPRTPRSHGPVAVFFLIWDLNSEEAE